jgi:hypothetical protein
LAGESFCQVAAAAAAGTRRGHAATDAATTRAVNKQEGFPGKLSIGFNAALDEHWQSM